MVGLSNDDIKARLRDPSPERRLVIEPLTDEQIGPGSVDLTLGNEVGFRGKGRVSHIDPRKKESIEKICRTFAERRGIKAADVIHPTRVAITGRTKGAGLFEIMEILGKKKVLERMRKAGK